MNQANRNALARLDRIIRRVRDNVTAAEQALRLAKREYLVVKDAEVNAIIERDQVLEVIKQEDKK